MPLTTGTRLGSYELVSLLGAGGMGEVYRARDTKLGRDVALKILPEVFAADSDRLARFEREAQVLASLNHPHIAAIYSLEESNGTRALVLELVEGPTLADRIAEGAIPLAEALPLARQIADALEAAHGQGIIHRDLKPANIKIRPDGTVKVLDFGLAKLAELSSAASDRGLALSQSPTITTPAMMTGVGVILGTAAYMSPEQAKGRVADKRSDVWAFGCMLYEMLTGRRAFEGEGIADTVSRILQRDPDFTVLPETLPSTVRRLLARCLEKDRNKRLPHIAIAAFEIEEAMVGRSVGATIDAPHRQRHRYWIPAVVASIIAGLAVTVSLSFLWRRESPRLPVKLQLVPPPNSTFGTIAVSPDGRMIAFTAEDAAGKSQLWIRFLDSVVSRPLQSTEGAAFPFWSPDSQAIGFFAGNSLKRVDVTGGTPRTLCELINNRGGPRGGTWSRDGVIVFTAEAFGAESLYQVSALGGEPRALPSARIHHRHWPVFLPDGRRFLYFGGIYSGETGAYVGSLDSSESRLLLQADAFALLAPASSAGNPDVLLFVRNQTLMAQRVDRERMVLLGAAQPVADRVGADLSTQRSTVSVSNTGVLVYTSGTGVAQLRWFDRSGKFLNAVGGPGINVDMRLSPDGRLVAVQREDGSGAADLWLFDLTRGATQRFTTDPAYDAAPVWTPDGKRLFFFSMREGPWSIYEKPSSGTTQEQLILKTGNNLVPGDVSPDGKFLLYVDTSSQRGDILVLPLGLPVATDAPPRVFVATPADENFARFSPDGRWVVYRSDETGRYEVYVRAFNPDGSPGNERFTVSTDGGIEPVWAKRGNEIFYIGAADMLTAVTVQSAPVFKVGVPRALFKARRTGVVGYDVRRWPEISHQHAGR